jgi:hypothetical protein
MPVTLKVKPVLDIKEHISPESRFRMPKLFDFVGRKMGAGLLSGEIPSDDDYYLVGEKMNGEGDIIEKAETELIKSLFRLPQDEMQERVFDISEEGDMEIFNISGSKYGKEYQSSLNEKFQKQIRFYSSAYRGMVERGESKEAEQFLSALRKGISKNPDTGELSYKLTGSALGDIYLNPKGEFSDYWNIGLDKYEKLSEGANLKRALAAPFTRPPTVRGSIELGEEAPFYQSLFPDLNRSTEDKLIENMKDESIF